jgi:hypothetical protein
MRHFPECKVCRKKIEQLSIDRLAALRDGVNSALAERVSARHGAREQMTPAPCAKRETGAFLFKDRCVLTVL